MADMPKTEKPENASPALPAQLEKNATPDKTQDSGGEAPAPEPTAEDAAALVGEREKALRDIGEEQLEPPTPFDIGGGNLPGPDDKGEPERPPEPDKPSPHGNSAKEERAPTADSSDKGKEPAEKESPANTGCRGKPPKNENLLKFPEKSRPPISPEHQKALTEYNKANEKYKKDLNKWANQQPGDNIAQPDPPVRPKPPKTEKEAAGGKNTVVAKEAAPPPAPVKPDPPLPPREAPRSSEAEQVVYLNLSDLHPFKNHPFSVRDDAEMRSLVESVKSGGVNQPALVRPHPDGNGYEIIAGHRRQKASELAGFADIPCIVRNMTDDEAILAMTDDNLRQRSEILPSEKAVSLKMQVEAIKHQGARNGDDQKVNGKEAGQRSVDIVGERNGMSPKQVQRYIRLTDLVPDLTKMMDDKKLGFTTAFEFSFIKPKNQNLIAVSIEGQQSKPSEAQAKRLRELDGEGKLNGDVIDGILCEEKREADKVIISGDELQKYFGKDKTPRQMKDQIIKLLDDWAGKEKAIATPEKKPALEK